MSKSLKELKRGDCGESEFLFLVEFFVLDVCFDWEWRHWGLVEPAEVIGFYVVPFLFNFVVGCPHEGRVKMSVDCVGHAFGKLSHLGMVEVI